MGKSHELRASEEERRALEEMGRSSDRQEADRARAILQTLRGRSRSEIAEALCVTPDQVSRWRGQYARGGVDALRARPNMGRPGVLAAAALPVVDAILAEPAPEGMVWTVPRLAEEVHRRSGVQISESWLSAVMRKKGGIAGVGRGTRSRAGKMWIKSNARV